jgi:hypothetical protein
LRPDGLLHCNDISIINIPGEVNQLRQESSIALSSTAHLYESLFNTPGPKQNISELPAWLSIIRSESDSLFESINRSRLVLRLIARKTNFKPQDVISRTERGCLLILSDSFIESIIRFQECGPNHMGFRIGGSKQESGISGVQPPGLRRIGRIKARESCTLRRPETEEAEG